MIATWVVEVAVHQLDLDVGGAPPTGAALARRTLEAIAEHALPEAFGDDEAVLAGLGRTGWPPGVPGRGPFPVSL
ncbi:hypothetical protein KIN34_03580 [Cellulomonas sp. DKR-3]|uniref:Mycothiol-dependent maleylpyruvate isomerase metal-binding domain-containing protein n=1 Tax=Cellulomonas fulva TaxID=2835530 RepID=A0ABS5TW72_9CELL|nr:hypothetical protein [Cellulomonas fulva]MBT0993365.1 hypothetical protein [Cellulomonas fulva]